MSSEQTYIMVKPDGVQRGLVGDIISRFEKRGKIKHVMWSGVRSLPPSAVQEPLNVYRGALLESSPALRRDVRSSISSLTTRTELQTSVVLMLHFLFESQRKVKM